MHVCMMKSTSRRTVTANKPIVKHNIGFSTTQPDTIAYCELDSHADTTCFGSNFTLVYSTDQRCDVAPYSSEYKAMEDIPIVGAATAYDDQTTGQTTILLFHQGLWFGNKLDHSLINPNQLRSFGIVHVRS